MVAQQWKILVVEDNPQMRRMVQTLLMRKGYEVHLAPDAETGLRLLDELWPHLVILDVQLPTMDGLRFCQLARDHHEMAILMVSGRGDAADRIRGLELGADDYLPKPFDAEELLARVHALLRRASRRLASSPGEAERPEVREPTAKGGEILTRGPLQMDFRSHEIRLGGQIVQATPLEFRLLGVFMRDPGRAFTRERLLELAWGDDYAPGERLVDTHVKHLRRKLEAAQPGYQPIVSVRGVGYRFLV